MNSLYEDLEAVEGACFRDLHLLAEPLHLMDMTETQIWRKNNVNTLSHYFKVSSAFNLLVSVVGWSRNDHLFSIQSTKHCYSWVKSLTRFSLTMPSLAAKKARTCEMKCFSSGFKRSQCTKSLDRSTWKTQHQQTLKTYNHVGLVFTQLSSLDLEKSLNMK